MPHENPVAELATGNRKTFTDTFYGIQPSKVFRKNTEDKEQPITEIRNDKIWKDGMCIFAGTDKAHTTEIMADQFTINKANNRAPIISMDTAGIFALQQGQVLSFGRNPFMQESKSDLDEDLIRINLQDRDFFSYHNSISCTKSLTCGI